MSYTRIIVGAIIILVGINILFDIDIFRFIIPVILIWLGIKIIWGKDRYPYAGKVETAEDRVRRVLIFSGINQKILSDDFEGGEVVAIFGGGEVDLSDVKTKRKTIEFNLVAIFGGLRVILPAGWSVRSEGVGILGGFNNQVGKDTKKTVEVQIKGVAILGGVDVVN